MALTKVRGLGLGTLDDNITFSTAGKGVHLGVTSATASNLQDDYEFGNWTPVYGGSTGNPTATYDFQKGSYVKVGNLVHVQGRLRTDATSGGSGNLQVTGLPFTSINQSNHYSTLHIGYSSSWAADKFPISGLLNANNSFVTLYKARASDARDGRGIASSATDLTDAANNNDIMFSMTYRAD